MIDETLNVVSAEITGAVGIVQTSDELNFEQKHLFQKLIHQFTQKAPKNMRRWRHYNDEEKVKNLGIAVPPKFEDKEKVDISIGWSAKAVDMLAEISNLDGFYIEGDANDTLESIMVDNDFQFAYEMAVPSELIFGCGFWTVTKNENNKVQIKYYDALNACALWDYKNSRVKCGFVVDDYDYRADGTKRVAEIIYFTEDKICFVKRVNEVWQLKVESHSMGRPMMEAMCYLPSYTRPFGKSRITKTVMSITEEMQRCVLRCMLASELYTSPIKALLNLSEEQYEQANKSKQDLYTDKIWLFSRSEDDEISPEIIQLPQTSMAPHIDVMKNLASRMSAESCLPLSSLGIIHEQPASAEALKAALDDLCKKADKLNTCNSRALKNIAKMALAIKKNVSVDKLDDKEKSVVVSFTDPFKPSIAQMTDAMLKQASVTPWLTEMELYWKNLGYSEDERKIIMDNKDSVQLMFEMRKSSDTLANSDFNYKSLEEENAETKPEEEEKEVKAKEIDSAL